MVDHQHHLAIHRPVARSENVRGVRIMLARQDIRPYIDKDALVRDLTGLDADGGVPAMRDTFVMHDPGGRLIQCLQADPPQAEAQIGILEIGRRVTFVETTQAGEHRPFDHQRRAGTVIHLAHVVVHRAWRDPPSGRNSSPRHPAR